MKITGKTWKYGDGLTTDYMLPGKYLELTDPEEMATHAMEGIDPGFTKRVKQGDIIVAGEDFGCGSSREHAVWCLRSVGISIIVASSFARIFFRNCINNGMLAIECPDIENRLTDLDEIEIAVADGCIRRIKDGKEIRFVPVPEFAMELIEAGGLLNYISGSAK